MNAYLHNPDKAASHLRKLTYDGAVRKYGFTLSCEVKERIDFELEIICGKYNPNIFLILHDLMETMENKGIMVGPGRGRILSSIVAYCLNITHVDPLKHNFIFELFLSPERVSLPDIYFNIEDEQEAIRYLKEKYGFCPEVFEGWGTFKLSFMQLTFVRLNALSIIHDCLKLIKKRHEKDIDINDIPLNDEATYKLFEQNDTIGVFYFETDDMVFDSKYWLSKVNTIGFDDLVAIISLYDMGSTDDLENYCLRKNDNASIRYAIPELDFILDRTYGIAIYVEQIVLIARKIAGFNRYEADLLQYVITRKKKEKEMMAMLKEQFISRGCTKGYLKESLCSIWEKWEAVRLHVHEPYAFGQALISYQTAWLKCHYSIEFYMASIKNPWSQGNLEKIMEDCRDHGIEIGTI